MANGLIAKSVKLDNNGYVYQTLEGHTSDVLMVGSQILNQLEKFDNFKFINADVFYKTALTTMTFHDYGKHLKEFQGAIQQDESASTNKRRKISHALYSTLFIEPNLGDELADWVCGLSILSHHSSLHKSLFSGNVTIPVITDVRQKLAKDIFEALAEICKQQTGWRPSALLRQSELSYINSKGKTASITRIRDQVKISDLKQLQFYNLFKDHLNEAKQLYALAHMVLKLSDEYASNYFEKNADHFKAGQIIGSIIESPQKIYEGITTTKDQLLKQAGFTLHPFQEKFLKYKNPMILLRAPCGRGKTLAALLYALKQNRQRIIFCLPTQITSNAMVKELSRLMTDPIGFYHGLRKFLKLDEETQEMVENWLDNTKQSTQNDFRSDLFYSTPVVVSTIDHLIYSLIRAYPQADVALGNLMSAVVIYDEIHAYEPYTLRQVLGGMKILHHYGIPQMLMSATLPVSLAKYCRQEFGATIIEDKIGLKFSPVIVEKRKKDIIEYLDEICSLASKGQKVLIVTNTIDRSRLIFDLSLKSMANNFPIHLYNSLFTPRDRSIGDESKEAILLKLFAKGASGPAILVATQAVEMSLNISADVLFTDWCPMDALVQRAGRVNRSSEVANIENRVIVCRVEKKGKPYFAPYFFGRKGEENHILKSWNLLHEGHLSHSAAIQAVDVVYENMDFQKEEKVTKLFKESILYGERINVLGREEDPSYFNVRNDPEKQNLATVSVVPTIYAEQFRRSLKGVDLYVIKVPLYWMHQYPAAINPFISNGEEVNGLYEIEAPYNPNTGLSIEQFDEAHTLIV